jgi:hypothetical protein
MTAQKDMPDLKTITRRLIQPLIIITLVNSVVIGSLVGYAVHHRVTKTFQEKSKALTETVANVLGDPLAMGEYDHMQQILRSTKSFEEDLSYAHLLSPDGRVLASTDPSKKDALMNSAGFEQDVLKTQDFTSSHPTPGILEMDMPIKSAGIRAGVLRAGFSLERMESKLLSTDTKVLAAVIVMLWVGAVLYFLYIREKIISPLLSRSGMNPGASSYE